MTAGGRGQLVLQELVYEGKLSVVIIWFSDVFHLPLAIPKGPRKGLTLLVETRKSHPGLPYCGPHLCFPVHLQAESEKGVEQARKNSDTSQLAQASQCTDITVLFSDQNLATFWERLTLV